MPKQSISTKEIINNYGATFAFIIAIIVFSFTSRGFFSGQNLQNILVQSTSLGICAFGLTFVLLTGEIDMSYAGVIGLVGTVLAGMLKDGHAIGMVSLVCLGNRPGNGHCQCPVDRRFKAAVIPGDRGGHVSLHGPGAGIQPGGHDLDQTTGGTRHCTVARGPGSDIRHLFVRPIWYLLDLSDSD